MFFKSKQPDFRKSILTSVVPSDLQFTYNKKRGTIIAINSERISTLLKRSRNSFKRYLDNSDVYEKISSQTANHLFSAKGDKGQTQGEKNFSICNIMKDYEVGTTFYFVKNMPLNNSNIEIRNLISELTKKKKRKYFRKNKPKKNNSIFLQKWKKIKSLENDVQFYKKEIKKIKEKNEKFVKKLKSDILSNLDIQNCVITAVKNYLEAKKGLLKEQIFEYAFLNGTNQIISKENGVLLPDGCVLQDSQAKYFFAILLQPLDWC